jgi:hypothetical protein
MYKKFFYFIFFVAVIIFCYSCSGSHDSDYNNKHTKFMKGDYDFSFSDSLGTKLVEGTLTIDSNSASFTGRYDITQKDTTVSMPGMTMMKGSLNGTYSRKDNSLFINMNPKLADANIFIKGKVYKNSLIGDWSYSTMMGVKKSGSFIAIYKEQQ